MKESIRRICWTDSRERNSESLLTREWLVTNGLGGYASGTISGVVTRRYHGLLIAALANPFGRTVMLNHLSEIIYLGDGSKIDIGGEEKGENDLAVHAIDYLTEFRLEYGVPVWHYEFDGYVLEKKIIMPYKQNSVAIFYKLLSGKDEITLTLRPSLHFRGHESPVNTGIDNDYKLIINGRKYEVAGHNNIPNLKLFIHDDEVSLDISRDMLREIYYRLEAQRGYEFKGVLWSPGSFRIKLQPGAEKTVCASTEDWDTILANDPENIISADKERRKELLLKVPDLLDNESAAELIMAADQFIITPAGRVSDERRSIIQGGEVRTVIAGYHWFTDWGRDTMISLEGLTLTTGRLNHAKCILRTFAHYVKDGLIPNLFPEGKHSGLYHTADASLWFFQAVKRYLDITNDFETLEFILPKFKEIIDSHIKGTKFKIHVDPKDGLLHQGEEGYQLTWMDAKVADWVVTPRRGKAVEINALWYNALCLFVEWMQQNGSAETDSYRVWLEKCKESFNRRFWYAEGNYLYDVVDGETGDDSACRPNQIFSISLNNPVLDRDKWKPVINTVKERLLTPVGLRSLAPGHPDYKEKYFGDLRSRDAAYHQGTVWAWLIGPFIDAWLRTYPDDKENPRKFLEGFEAHLCEACVGSISEVFDAEPPFMPRGCIAQAWSVAEVLRCIKKIKDS